MKKKHFATPKDKNDWVNFIKNLKNINPKEEDIFRQNYKSDQIKKLDLHGLTLNEANKEVKNFINKSFESGYKKILIVTGKGSRSKTHENPYISKKFSVLKNSVPEYIRNNKELSEKISKISKANPKDGGEGAIYVFLKNKFR